MNQIVIKLLPFYLFMNLLGNFTHPFVFKAFDNPGKLFSDSVQNDTCIINGMNFEILNTNGTTDLKGIIKNGHIKIISKQNQNFKFRVIRYVFSIRRDEKSSSIRSYGDLVTYSIIDLLKEGEPGDLYYFEDIIIVNPSKEILDNAVKPIIIKKI